MEFETRIARLLILAVLGIGVLLGVGPLRRWCVAHPAWVLTAIAVLDVALLFFAMTPFVVIGYDESQFLEGAQRLRGADLPVAWIRTPLPILAVAVTPFHPGILGILAKQLAMLATYALVRRPLGVGLALFAAVFVSFSEEMVGNCCEVVSEPYGAAALAGFALAVTRGGPVALFVTATLGAMSRWQMLWLLPVATLVAFRRHGWRPALAGSALAVAGFSFCVWLTHVDPVRAFLQERQRDHTVVERILFYLSPKSGLGLGLVGMLLAIVGGVALARERPRSALAPCALIFLVYLAGVVSVGVIVPRFLGPAVPLGAVLVVRGIASILARWRRLATRWPAAIAASILIVVSAIPVHQPRMRERRLTSPQAPIALERESVLVALGDAVPYCDVDAQKVSAILARRCIAVGPGHAETEHGHVERAQIPPGSFYLTHDPAGRLPMWSCGRLALVRW